jgi:hypothetical protein
MRLSQSYFLWIIVVFLVIHFFLIFVAYTSGIRSNGLIGDTVNDENRYFIYNWPETVTNVWPSNYTHHRLSIERKFQFNGGTGPVLDERQGLYHSHQYMLFSLLYRRLLQSSHRTMDPNQASYFFIPYDIGMDSCTRTTDGALAATSCPRLPEVLQLLQQSPYFVKKHGADHFMVFSINHMMLFYNNAVCQMFLKLCLNCTKLSIDHYSAEVYPELRSMPHLVHNWHSIPFPSNYHRSSVSFDLPWKSTAALISGNAEAYLAARPLLVSFVGSTLVTATRQMKLRAEIIKACAVLGPDCHASVMSSHSSNAEYNQQSLTRSRLCLMPGGDFPARKAFLDAMLSGCIPVTFQLFAAQSQWLAHWGGPARAMECTVHVPMQQALRNTVQALRSLATQARNVTFLAEKLLCIAQVGDRFQYSLSEEQGEEGAETDAFEVAIGIVMNGTS